MKITPEAEHRIAQLAAEPTQKLRIQIQAGGCSGIEKVMLLDSVVNDDDTVVQHCVVVDSMSWQFVENSVLHWHNSLGGQKFELSIDEATANCGCGRSFGI